MGAITYIVLKRKAQWGWYLVEYVHSRHFAALTFCCVDIYCVDILLWRHLLSTFYNIDSLLLRKLISSTICEFDIFCVSLLSFDIFCLFLEFDILSFLQLSIWQFEVPHWNIVPFKPVTVSLMASTYVFIASESNMKRANMRSESCTWKFRLVKQNDVVQGRADNPRPQQNAEKFQKNDKWKLMKTKCWKMQKNEQEVHHRNCLRVSVHETIGRIFGEFCPNVIHKNKRNIALQEHRCCSCKILPKMVITTLAPDRDFCVLCKKG
jgi:hypothetical protein